MNLGFPPFIIVLWLCQRSILLCAYDVPVFDRMDIPAVMIGILMCAIPNFIEAYLRDICLHVSLCSLLAFTKTCLFRNLISQRPFL